MLTPQEGREAWEHRGILVTTSIHIVFKSLFESLREGAVLLLRSVIFSDELPLPLPLLPPLLPLAHTCSCCTAVALVLLRAARHIEDGGRGMEVRGGARANRSFAQQLPPYP